ncbi:unnamed protein product [Microthlaspi erraticum]|uniref:Uncharacterized protein n=1 Tax=Microthlaspi erraticum TaxID=1685480 RepID=A0A6D2KRM8_9BRAS|nr:unnamed protein product [Microthlaspi erraticum]
MPVKETEADSRYVVGCASMEPTNTSYPNATHTPNVSKPDNVNRRTIQFPEGKELLETDNRAKAAQARKQSSHGRFPPRKKKSGRRKTGRKIFPATDRRPSRYSDTVDHAPPSPRSQPIPSHPAVRPIPRPFQPQRVAPPYIYLMPFLGFPPVYIEMSEQSLGV